MLEYRQYLYMHEADTIVAFCRQCMESEVACTGDIIAVLPCERCLARTDINAVFPDAVGLMDEEAEAVYAVAPVDGRHEEAVFSARIQGVCLSLVQPVRFPCMCP